MRENAAFPPKYGMRSLLSQISHDSKLVISPRFEIHFSCSVNCVIYRDTRDITITLFILHRTFYQIVIWATDTFQSYLR